MDMKIFGSESHWLCYSEKSWWSYKYLSLASPKKYHALECKGKLASALNALNWIPKTKKILSIKENVVNLMQKK